MMVSTLRIILVGAALSACARTKQPQTIGPELGQSTAAGPSDPTRPNPPPQAAAIAGGPSQSIRGAGHGPVVVAPGGSAGAFTAPSRQNNDDNAIANGSTPDPSTQTVTNPVGGLTPTGGGGGGGGGGDTTGGGAGTGTATTGTQGPVTGAAPNGPGTGTGPATPTGPATGTGVPTPDTGTGAPGTTGTTTGAGTTPNPGGGTSTTGGSGR